MELAKLKRDWVLATALCVSPLVGCKPRSFDDFKTTAGTSVLGRPSEFPENRFGLTLAGYEGVAPSGAPASRLAVGGGTAAPVEVYSVWEDNELVLGKPMLEFCSPAAPCPADVGLALAGLSRFNTSTLCVLVTSLGTGV